MLFLLHASEGPSPMDTAIRMGLQQFKTLMTAAKVTSSSVPPEKMDELFMSLQASPGALARCAHVTQLPALRLLVACRDSTMSALPLLQQVVAATWPRLKRTRPWVVEPSGPHVVD